MEARRTASIALAVVLVLAGLYAGWGALTGLGSGRGGDCRVSRLEHDRSPIAVRAECDWSIPPERLQAILGRLGAHALYFNNLEESAVIDREGDSATVRQLHRATGISDRVIVVAWEVTPVDGGRRYSWRKAGDQSAVAGRGVEVENYEGSWEITETEAGSHIVLEFRYAPGGSVPFFVVHTFQESSARQALSDLRTAAESEFQVAAGPPEG